ncbi:unnamed protein product [Durusdinium trenchii]|uniref:Uncharacterized protein n=1 Tax=Durusdinium trenchii TaxID=1381693 RepID=A0ABP0JGG7_9DINO
MKEDAQTLRRSTTVAEKRAIYSQTRAILQKIRAKQPSEADENAALDPSGKIEASYAQSGDWRKVRQFFNNSKKVRKTHDVMQVWLQVKRDNTRRRLMEALTEFIQSEALRAAQAAEAAEVFHALETAAEALQGEPREEIVDIHVFSKKAGDLMESLATMKSEQDELLREVEALQASMNLSSRRAGRLVAKINASEMGDKVKAIQALAASVLQDDEEEDAEESVEEQEQEECAASGAASEAPDELTEGRLDDHDQTLMTFAEQREELIQKIMKIEVLLRRSRALGSSQDAIAEEMKENLCPLLPRMRPRPRCGEGHLMNEVSGRAPTSRSEECCCSCGLDAQRFLRSARLATRTPSKSLPQMENAQEEPATHWVCQDCLFHRHVAIWMCKRCSLECEKEEIDRVGAALEAKARKPENLLKLQAFMESIDPGIRAEALQRLGFHQVLVEASCPSKRVQYVRKEKPKWKPPQALRRKSTQRASLSVSHVDVNFQTPVEESPAPASPPAPPLPELPELGPEMTRITIEGVLLERTLGHPEQELRSSWAVRARRSQLAVEAASIAKRLAPRVEAPKNWESTQPPSTKLQRRVEQATLIAWKERAEHHDTPRGERLVDHLKEADQGYDRRSWEPIPQVQAAHLPTGALLAMSPGRPTTQPQAVTRPTASHPGAATCDDIRRGSESSAAQDGCTGAEVRDPQCQAMAARRHAEGQCSGARNG